MLDLIRKIYKKLTITIKHNDKRLNTLAHLLNTLLGSLTSAIKQERGREKNIYIRKKKKYLNAWSWHNYLCYTLLNLIFFFLIMNNLWHTENYREQRCCSDRQVSVILINMSIYFRYLQIFRRWWQWQYSVWIFLNLYLNPAQKNWLEQLRQKNQNPRMVTTAKLGKKVSLRNWKYEQAGQTEIRVQDSSAPVLGVGLVRELKTAFWVYISKHLQKLWDFFPHFLILN